jgi:methylenetetrahydrofolate dehydrogenase (NADP+)/methenyltetrahydrofolate cyclohydrolase
MQLLDGKKTAEDIKGEIAVEVQKMKKRKYLI